MTNFDDFILDGWKCEIIEIERLINFLPRQHHVQPSKMNLVWVGFSKWCLLDGTLSQSESTSDHNASVWNVRKNQMRKPNIERIWFWLLSFWFSTFVLAISTLSSSISLFKISSLELSTARRFRARIWRISDFRDRELHSGHVSWSVSHFAMQL